MRFVAALLLSLAPLAAQSGDATWARPVPKGFEEPPWLDQGVVLVGNWEPLNVRLRLGLDAVTGLEIPADVEARYRREHSEETIRRLKEAGVNLYIAHFYKMGLQADREEIDYTKQVGALCRKYGIKLGVYIGDTIYTETMLRDQPEAKDWVCYTEGGDPVRYGGQPHRYRSDFNHPGYVEHIRNVIRVAVEEVKADFIHFDNVLLRQPPATCYTPDNHRRFREFLSRKYTPVQLKQRLGFSDISAVRVPSWSSIPNPAAMARVADPLVQEWVDFRCQDLADYYGKLAAHIRKLNPAVVAEINPHGVEGNNTAFLIGVDHPRLVRHGSVFWTEEPNNAGIDEQGVLVSKIRSFKVARSLDTTLFVKCRFVNDPSARDGGARSYRLRMAEAMAFNRNCLGDVGKPLDVYLMDDQVRHYIRFYLENNRHFSATRTVADVAVLRSFPSMAYNSHGPHLETVLMEQLLIQHKIPFDIISDAQLDGLSRYRAVILANQETLTDQAVDRIRAYVRAGGGLVATGHTSLLNGWRRVRPDYALADVLHIRAAPERALPAAWRGAFGQGRAAYVPAVEPDSPPRPGATGYGKAWWKLPRNSSELLDAVRFAAGAPFSVEFTNAPLTTTMELTDKKDSSARILHWLNYRLGTRVAPVEVSLALPSGGKAASVELLSPERKGPESVPFRMEAGRLKLRLPELEIYQVAVVRLQP